MRLFRFDLAGRGSSVRAEARGAVATFLTMAYILFANPAILAAAGVPFEPAVAATALAAGLSCVLMGLFADFPLALASGMGLNAVLAYQVAPLAGSWRTAMGLVVIEGLLVVALVLSGLREAVMSAIPRDLKRAIGAGIGLFVAFIGAVNAKIIVVPAATIATLATDPHATLPPVGFGSLRAPETALALGGLLFTSALLARRVRGALVIGILGATAVALALGLAKGPGPLRWPSFSTLGSADVRGALRLDLVPLLLAFFLVDFFDTLGTVTAIAEQSGLSDERGQIPRIRAILTVDGLGAVIGGLCGASSVTSYIESAAGVAEGARTGLSTVFVGALFFLAIPLAPFAGVVPPAATAPALILTGFLMVSQIARIDFSDLDSAIPAFVTLLLLPLTYSISHGIGFGFITHVGMKILRGRPREVHPLMYIVAAAFAAYFIAG